MLAQTLTVLSALGLALAGPTATPYADASCNNPITSYSYTDSMNGTQYTNTPFNTGGGVSAPHNATISSNFVTYKNMQFDDVQSATNTKEREIYWKFSVGDGCRVVFMKPYQNQPNIPGAVVVNAGSPDACYYNDPQDVIQMSFCCGSGDCQNFSVGEAALNEQDQKPAVTSRDLATRDGNSAVMGGAKCQGPSCSAAKGLGAAPVMKRGPQPRSIEMARDVNNHGSIAARAIAEALKRDDSKSCNNDTTCYNTEWGKCTVKVTNNVPVSKPGKQQAASHWIACNDGSDDSCKISTAITDTYSFETSVSQTQSSTTGTSSSSSSSQTNTNTREVTNTDGYKLSVGASIGFGPFSASTDAETDHTSTTDNTNTQTNAEEQTSSVSFSNTVANQSGHSTTNSKASSLTETLQVKAGAYALLTFTPYYNCYQVSIDCGKPWSWDIGNGATLSVPTLDTEICEPDTLPDKTTNGVYEILYTEQSD